MMHHADAPALDGMTTPSDNDAIDEVIRGNREMFEVLVRRYNQRLFRIGMAYLKKHELVEDAMQNAYVKAFVHLNRFHRDAQFATWMTRIMINECLMLLRHHRSSREEAWDEDAVAASANSVPPEGASNLSVKEMKALLEQAVSDLPLKYRTVYVLREVQQLTTAEAAASLGVSIESVKVDLHRAREMLKTRLLQSAEGIELFRYEAPFCNRMTGRVMGRILAAS